MTDAGGQEQREQWQQEEAAGYAVAFQGNPGSYGEIAALNALPQVRETLGYPTFHEVARAVENGEADYGVLPVENSLMGAIHQSIDLLTETELHVTGEVVVRVSHCLMALPGVEMADIRKVGSQQPALDQCTHLIREHGWQPLAKHDTAGSAKDLAERGARDEAAIASRRAAELYGLNILQTGVEDEPFNFTRFMVLSRHAPEPSDAPHKTSLIFAVRHPRFSAGNPGRTARPEPLAHREPPPPRPCLELPDVRGHRGQSERSAGGAGPRWDSGQGELRQNHRQLSGGAGDGPVKAAGQKKELRPVLQLLLTFSLRSG